MALSTYDNSTLIDNPTAVQYIKVLASKDAEGNLSLLVLNNDIESDITVQVNLNGYTHNAVVSVSEYNGPEATSMNTCDEPNVVGVTTVDKELGEGDFTYTFPAHSITRFDFSK